MSKWKARGIAGALGLLAATLVYAQQRIVISNALSADRVYYGAATSDLSAPYPGQVFIDTGTASTLPEMSIYDHVAAAWNEVPTVDTAETVSGAWTFSGAATFTGDITPKAVVQSIWRDDFCGVGVLQNDGTAESGVDTEINDIFTLAGGTYYQWIEQTATLSPAQQVNSGCGLDVAGDITANDGQEIRFVADALGSVHRVQTASDEFYFEISITIADISAVDGDLAFGLMLPAAQQDPPQHDGLDTYFIATLSDNAGDLDFEADVDGGAQVNDDSGITWADAATKVIRFVLDGDGYAASVDGTAITLTNVNAGGSNDFTDGDKVLPFFYYTQGAEGADTGIVINYVEWGEGTL